MKTLGMIGGIGPESTVDYYLSILKRYKELRPNGGAPSILINSVDLDRLRRYFEVGELANAAQYFVAEIKRLAAAGADFGLLSANTAHIVFDEVQSRSPIPLISMTRATCEAAKKLGIRKVGLLGTRFTMQARFYPDSLSKEGIALAVPDENEQAYIHEKYFDELVKGIFLPATRGQFVTIIERMKEQDGIDGLILGGTELPLLLRAAGNLGIPFLDTTRIHVEAAVEELLRE